MRLKKGANSMRGMIAMVVLFLLVGTVACAVGENLRRTSAAASVIPTATPTRPWCPTATPWATAFVPSGPPPPPPGTPTRQPPTLTGPRPTVVPLPTLNPAQLTPSTSQPVVFPTELPLNLVTPVADWVSYHNPDIGFSFDYPANWHIEAPDQSCRPLAPTGTSIEIRNYNINTAVEKGLLLPEMLRVRISVGPNFAAYGGLDKWVVQLRHDSTPSPDVSFSPIEHFSMSNLPSVRWTAKAPMAQEGVVEVLTGKGIWFYYITAYPASSQQLAAFDRMVSNFQIP